MGMGMGMGMGIGIGMGLDCGIIGVVPVFRVGGCNNKEGVV